MQCMNNEGGSRLVFSSCFARDAVAALSRQKSRFLCEVRRPPCLRLERKYAQWRLMGKGRTRQSWWTSVAIRHIREAFFSSILLVFFHFPIFLFFSHFAFFCSASSPSGSLDKNSAPSTSLNIEKEREKKRRQREEQKSTGTEQYHEHFSILSTRLTTHLTRVRIHSAVTSYCLQRKWKWNT